MDVFCCLPGRPNTQLSAGKAWLLWHNRPRSGHIQPEMPPKDKPARRAKQDTCQPEPKLPVSSSTPPEFAAEQAHLFRVVLESMNRRHIPFVVSGAFALRMHTGICRDTKDLDLFLPAESASAALRELAQDGFETEISDPAWLAKAHRNGFYVDLITGMSNGVFSVDQSWIERGISADIMGVPVRVLAAEELFASKLFVTRRERFDGADLCHIIYGTKGKLDWKRVLELTGDAHWELVLWAIVLFDYAYPAHRHYVPRMIWDVLLHRLRHSFNHPSLPARFRGSLIDPKMFAIDVEDWGMDDLCEEYRAQRKSIVAYGLDAAGKSPAA